MPRSIRSGPTAVPPGRRRRARRASLLAALALAGPGSAWASAAGPAEDPAVRAFMAEMVAEHGFAPQALESLFRATVFSQQVLDAFARPAESKPWHEYRRIFLTPTRIERGVAFWQAHAEVLARASERYGIPPEVIVAIIGVETLYGARTGSIRVLDALTTLAFRYPRRARFFRRELIAYLLLAREEGLDPGGLTGSYAGAIGVPQFIPTSYRAYAIDFDSDGTRDLLGSVSDAIGSVANYLGRHGWRQGAPIAVPATVAGRAPPALLERGLEPSIPAGELTASGVALAAAVPASELVALLELDLEAGAVEHWAGFRNFYALTRYNPSKLYAMAVFQLAGEIRLARAGRGN